MVLALCLCIGMLAGCGSTAASTEDKASSAAPAQEQTQAPEEEPAAPETESGSAEEASAAEEATAVGEGEITQHAKDVFGVEEAPAENSYPLDTDESLTLVATFPDPLFASYPQWYGRLPDLSGGRGEDWGPYGISAPFHLRFRRAV